MFTYDIIILLIVAGLGAGIVTGLAGASAATVVTPLLVTFSPIVAYTAIAISLITDVFASFFSFLTYKKHGNINIKDGRILTLAACIGAYIGSFLSSLIDNSFLGAFGGIMTFLLGINFLYKGIKLRGSDNTATVEKKAASGKHPLALSLILGLVLGTICGFVGAGGGLMILYVLTTVLKYDTKTAIGTSVLIMTFIALTGGISHFLHMDTEYLNMNSLLIAMAITSCSAVIGAKASAKFANRTSEDILLTIVGATFVVISTVMLLQKI